MAAILHITTLSKKLPILLHKQAKWRFIVKVAVSTHVYSERWKHCQIKNSSGYIILSNSSKIVKNKYHSNAMSKGKKISTSVLMCCFILSSKSCHSVMYTKFSLRVIQFGERMSPTLSNSTCVCMEQNDFCYF